MTGRIMGIAALFVSFIWTMRSEGAPGSYDGAPAGRLNIHEYFNKQDKDWRQLIRARNRRSQVPSQIRNEWTYRGILINPKSFTLQKADRALREALAPLPKGSHRPSRLVEHKLGEAASALAKGRRPRPGDLTALAADLCTSNTKAVRDAGLALKAGKLDVAYRLIKQAASDHPGSAKIRRAGRQVEVAFLAKMPQILGQYRSSTVQQIVSLLNAGKLERAHDVAQKAQFAHKANAEIQTAASIVGAAFEIKEASGLYRKVTTRWRQSQPLGRRRVGEHIANLWKGKRWHMKSRNLARATELLEKGDLDGALQIVDKALKRYPESVTLSQARGVFKQVVKRWQQRRSKSRSHQAKQEAFFDDGELPKKVSPTLDDLGGPSALKQALAALEATGPAGKELTYRAVKEQVTGFEPKTEPDRRMIGKKVHERLYWLRLQQKKEGFDGKALKKLDTIAGKRARSYLERLYELRRMTVGEKGREARETEKYLAVVQRALPLEQALSLALKVGRHDNYKEDDILRGLFAATKISTDADGVFSLLQNRFGHRVAQVQKRLEVVRRHPSYANVRKLSFELNVLAAETRGLEVAVRSGIESSHNHWAYWQKWVPESSPMYQAFRRYAKLDRHTYDAEKAAESASGATKKALKGIARKSKQRRWNQHARLSPSEVTELVRQVEDNLSWVKEAFGEGGLKL